MKKLIIAMIASLFVMSSAFANSHDTAEEGKAAHKAKKDAHHAEAGAHDAAHGAKKKAAH